jgi:hypothetical protein
VTTLCVVPGLVVVVSSRKLTIVFEFGGLGHDGDPANLASSKVYPAISVN